MNLNKLSMKNLINLLLLALTTENRIHKMIQYLIKKMIKKINNTWKDIHLTSLNK